MNLFPGLLSLLGRLVGPFGSQPASFSRPEPVNAPYIELPRFEAPKRLRRVPRRYNIRSIRRTPSW